MACEKAGNCVRYVKDKDYFCMRMEGLKEVQIIISNLLTQNLFEFRVLNNQGSSDVCHSFFDQRVVVLVRPSAPFNFF